MAETQTHAFQNITIFSDASFCPDSRAAGGAYWARTDSLRLSGSFALRSVKASHEAEVMTACLSIRALSENDGFRKELQKGRSTLLVLVVDCLTIKQAFEGESVSLSPDCRREVDEVLALRRKMNFGLKVNHVKAHTNGKAPRQWVNRWCDEAAREQMKRARKASNKAAQAC